MGVKLYTLDTHIYQQKFLPKAFENFYLYTLDNFKNYPHMNVDEIMPILLNQEPYEVTLRIVPCEKWYLDFESFEDYMMFNMRWT
jgi:hypothetical protein